MAELILASASPRRGQLLEQMAVDFRVKPSPIDEKALKLSGGPRQQVMDSALAKGMAVARLEPGAWVLAADTVVCVDEEILGKPADRAEGGRMLRKLSGRSHHVLTGLCLCRAGDEEKVCRDCEETVVWMRELDQRTVEAYLDTGEPMDKAGAYGIQGFGGCLVSRIEGCYFNVMGLPLYRTSLLFERAGIYYWRPDKGGR